MSKQDEKSQFIESWNNELANKDFDELVRIIVYHEKYNPEFVKLAHDKLISHKDYDEARVNTLVEELKKEPQPSIKDPANTILKVANTGCLIAKVLFWLMAIPLAFILINFNSTADNKAGALIIYVGLLGVYKIVKSLWKRNKSKSN
jgi:hypothetical protein